MKNSQLILCQDKQEAKFVIRKFRYSSSKGELAKNKKHQFAQKQALSLYGSDAIYSFIPKNACSTLRLSLALANGCINQASDFEWIHTNNETFSADLATLSKARYTFVVLRDPYSRLASVYLDKIVGYEFEAGVLCRKLSGTKINRDEGLFKKIKNKMHHRKSQGFIDALTFHDFVQLMKTPSTRNSNPHWRPQIDFLVYEDYDSWFCVEEFSKAMIALKRDVGLEVVDARNLTLHGTSGLKKLGDRDFSRTTALELRKIKEDGKCPLPSSLYNDELVQTVSVLYCEDISLYKAVFGGKNLMFT